jgi:hypothetical protein
MITSITCNYIQNTKSTFVLQWLHWLHGITEGIHRDYSRITSQVYTWLHEWRTPRSLVTSGQARRGGGSSQVIWSLPPPVMHCKIKYYLREGVLPQSFICGSALWERRSPLLEKNTTKSTLTLGKRLTNVCCTLEITTCRGTIVVPAHIEYMGKGYNDCTPCRRNLEWQWH